MAGPSYVLDRGFRATTEIEQFHAVMQTDKESVKLADSSGAFCIGVVQDQAYEEDGDVGRRIVNVRLFGLTRAVASAALAVGVKVSAAADGRVQAAAAGHAVLGVVTTPCENADEWVDLLMTPGAAVESA